MFNASQVRLCFSLLSALPLPAPRRGGCCLQLREEERGASWWNSNPLSRKAGLEAAHASQPPGVPASAMALPQLREQVPGASRPWTPAGLPGPARALISRYFGALSGTSQSSHR